MSSEGFHITFSSVFSSKVNCALKMRFSSYLDPSPQDLPQPSPWSNRELWELSTVVLSPLLLNAFCHLVSKENDLEEKALTPCQDDRWHSRTQRPSYIKKILVKDRAWIGFVLTAFQNSWPLNISACPY